MNKSAHILLLAALVALSACSKTPAYRNAGLSPERRTADLIRRMTVEEKLGQLICPLGWPMYEKTSDSTATWSQEYVKFIQEQHGGMLWATFRADPWTGKTLATGLSPRAAAAAYNALQHYAVDSTRLGIPVLLAEEAPHGHMAIGTTVFPTGIGMAASWDPVLLEEVGRSISEELRAVGAGIGYGPVVDLAREPRWSRVEETFGEDVYLTTEMARGMVRGASPKHNGWERGIISTLKHFVAYGIPQGGHNGNPSQVGMRDLRENFLPAFKGAVEEGALSVMTSYNSIDGIPSTSNKAFLTGILKEEWGFEGFVVSDLVSIDGLAGDHHVAADKAEAAEMALGAGCDVDLGAACYPLLADSKKQDVKALNAAVRRVLLLKFRLGLFDNPYVDEAAAARAVRSAEHLQTALKASREGVVLLENNGVLPLRKDMKVAVIGPNADAMYNQLGDYTAPQPDAAICTPLEGIREKIGAGHVLYAKGCAVRDTDRSGISAAVQAARRSDVAVVFVGGSSARDFGTDFLETGAAVARKDAVSDMESGEGYDRSTLGLMGLQNELLAAVKATGKPLVVVYIEGRPLDKSWASENADALLTQFYPGQAGGQAIADVLFGDYNPGGRLPVSVPRSVGQLPVYYNKPFPAGHDYVEEPAAPLYAFGYGLSYTSFSYDKLVCEKTGPAQVSVKVVISNTGSRDGDEVVQVYVTDTQASTVRPRKQLRAFKRVNIAAGESTTVEFTLDENAFALWNREMKRVVESGEFVIGVGGSSDAIALSESVEL